MSIYTKGRELRECSFAVRAGAAYTLFPELLGRSDQSSSSSSSKSSEEVCVIAITTREHNIKTALSNLQERTKSEEDLSKAVVKSPRTSSVLTMRPYLRSLDVEVSNSFASNIEEH